MKRPCEIPECLKLLNEMCAEWDKYPLRKDVLHDKIGMAKHKEIENKYLPKVFEAYDKYKKEHPEEFKEEN